MHPIDAQLSVTARSVLGVSLSVICCVALGFCDVVYAYRHPNKRHPSVKSSFSRSPNKPTDLQKRGDVDRTASLQKRVDSDRSVSPLLFEGTPKEVDRLGGMFCVGVASVLWLPSLRKDGALGGEVRGARSVEGKKPVVLQRLRLPWHVRSVRCLADGMALLGKARWYKVAWQQGDTNPPTLHLSSMNTKPPRISAKALLRPVETWGIQPKRRIFAKNRQGWRVEIHRQSIRVARKSGEIHHVTKIYLSHASTASTASAEYSASTASTASTVAVLVYQGVHIESLDQSGDI